MTGKSSVMRKLMVLMMAFAIMLTYSVVPMNQSFAASAKKPTKITLNAKSKTLTVGKTFKAKVKTVKPKKASKAVTWKSSNKKVATVSSKGVIKAKKAGKATITAVSKKNKKVKAKIKVTVKAKIKVGTATAEEFAAADFKVDARCTDSYAGWALGTDKNGGHIEGAVSFAHEWIDGVYNYDELEKMTREDALQQELADSGLIKGANIVVYDTNGSDADVVAAYLIENGFTSVKKYNASAEINATGAKLVSYKNYSMNVPAEVVKSISDYKVSGTALSDNAKAIVGNKAAGKVKILAASYEYAGKYPDGYVKDAETLWEETGYYTTGHVPGAEPVNTDDFEPEREAKRDAINTPGVTYGNKAGINWAADYLLVNDADLLKLVGKYGINKDDCVVVTGGQPMATIKIALVLKYAGVNDIHVMSAGYTDWNNNGYAFEKGKINKPTAGTDITSIGNPDVIDTQEEVVELLSDPKAQVVDTRTVEEFACKDSGYGYHDIAGKIANTVNSPSGVNYSSSMFYYRNPDASMRSQDVLEAMWKTQGIDTSKKLSFFCGSGWRAAEETWDAWVIGYENASMYNDGWQGWSNSGRPFIAADGKTYALDYNKDELVESSVQIDATPDFENMSKEKVWPHYGVNAIKDSDFVIDVRKASLFAESHYPGSVSAPVIKEDGGVPGNSELEASLEPAFAAAGDKRIVIVCNTGNALARRAMNYFQKAGKDMSNIVYFIGGAAQLQSEGKMVKIEFFTMDDTTWATYGTDTIVPSDDIVVDVRLADAFEAGHIEDSWSAPGSVDAIAAGSETAVLLDKYYKAAKGNDKRLVFICYSGNKYARRAMDYIYNTYPDDGITAAKVTYLKGGFNGWKTSNPYMIGEAKVDPSAKSVIVNATVNGEYLDGRAIYHLVRTYDMSKDAAFLSDADVFDFHAALAALGAKPWSDAAASLADGQTMSAAAAAGVGDSAFSHLEVFIGTDPLADYLKYEKNGTAASAATALDLGYSGNLENQKAWKSGCIACLQSCPAGITTNDAVGSGNAVKDKDYFSLNTEKLTKDQQVLISFHLK